MSRLNELTKVHDERHFRNRQGCTVKLYNIRNREDPKRLGEDQKNVP